LFAMAPRSNANVPWNVVCPAAGLVFIGMRQVWNKVEGIALINTNIATAMSHFFRRRLYPGGTTEYQSGRCKRNPETVQAEHCPATGQSVTATQGTARPRINGREAGVQTILGQSVAGYVAYTWNDTRSSRVANRSRGPFH
jgi:hypothetical protein